MRKSRSSFYGWLDQRMGIGSVMSRLLAGQVDPRWSWLRTTGMVCLTLVLVECITGPILGLYYTPSAATAYKEVVALDQNPLGKFLRGIHHWSSGALILISLITVARMFFFAEYKGKRDIVWLAAVLFFQFVLLFQLTGHVLPWDTNAVETTKVEAGLANNIWVVGPDIKRISIGGGTVTPATLTRAYGLHTMLLPLATVLLVAIPLFFHRLRSVEDREDEPPPDDPPRKLELYYPNHMAREMLASLGVFLCVAGLAWFGSTPLELEPTAANLSGYHALSEWYVLPLHAATLFPPFNRAAWEPVVTFLLPALLFGVMLLLPFIDRNPSRRAGKRKFAIASGAVTVFATLGLYLYAFVVERPMVQANRLALQKKIEASKTDPVLVELGKKVYADQKCDACHAINGVGGKSATDLTKAGVLHPDRDWQIKHLIKPTDMVPGSTMPAYGHLKKEEINGLAEYMISLR